MFDIGWSELLIIAIVMIVVVGPKDLPKMLRAFGKATARMRATANEFRNQFNEALKEAELDDVKTIIDETRKLDPRSKLTQVFEPIRSAGEEIRSSLTPGSTVAPPPAEPVAVEEPVPAAPVKRARKTPVKPAAAKTPTAEKAPAKAPRRKPAVKAAAPTDAIPAQKPAPARRTRKTPDKTGNEA